MVSGSGATRRDPLLERRGLDRSGQRPPRRAGARADRSGRSRNSCSTSRPSSRLLPSHSPPRHRRRPERHSSQSEWHQTRARPGQRPSAPPVSTTMRTSSGASARQSDPYDRNWIAGLAIALAVLSIPGLAAARPLGPPAAHAEHLRGCAHRHLAARARPRCASRLRPRPVDHRRGDLRGRARGGLGRRPRAHPGGGRRDHRTASRLIGARSPASCCCGRRGSARPARALRAAAACTCRTARGSPCGGRTSRRPDCPRRGPTPRRCRARLLALVGSAEVDPVARRLQPAVQVVDRAGVVLQGGRPDLADDGRRIARLVPVHRVLARSGRRLSAAMDRPSFLLQS